jgi:DNA repair protein RadC
MNADKVRTNKIKEASEYMDIKLLDYLIIVPEGKYLSFTEDGLL